MDFDLKYFGIVKIHNLQLVETSTDTKMYYKCLIPSDYSSRTVWGEICMNLDKCFCFLPLYPKEQPTNFH